MPGSAGGGKSHGQVTSSYVDVRQSLGQVTTPYGEDYLYVGVRKSHGHVTSPYVEES